MDLHQIGTGLGSGTYAQQVQEQQQQSSTTSTSTPSSSVSPSTTQHPQHFQQQHQNQLQPYNLHPIQPHGSYSLSWPRSRDLLHQNNQPQQYQPQQSNIKREVMGKHLDTGNASKNMDDSMPSTNDFVKKLYKFVPVFFFPLHSLRISISFFLPIGFFFYVCVGCWKILPFRMSYLGDRWVIVLLSKYVRFFLIS